MVSGARAHGRRDASTQGSHRLPQSPASGLVRASTAAAGAPRCLASTHVWPPTAAAQRRRRHSSSLWLRCCRVFPPATKPPRFHHLSRRAATEGGLRQPMVRSGAALPQRLPVPDPATSATAQTHGHCRCAFALARRQARSGGVGRRGRASRHGHAAARFTRGSVSRGLSRRNVPPSGCHRSRRQSKVRAHSERPAPGQHASVARLRKAIAPRSPPQLNS